MLVGTVFRKTIDHIYTEMTRPVKIAVCLGPLSATIDDKVISMRVTDELEQEISFAVVMVWYCAQDLFLLTEIS